MVEVTAKEIFDRRSDLVEQLTAVDLTLRDLLAGDPSLRLSADVRSLFDAREEICDELRTAGFEPWTFVKESA